MSQNRCCVPGCLVTKEDGIPLHRFPDPETRMAIFLSWLNNVGGEITTQEKSTIYTNRRVCRKHFEDVHKYPNNRLCKLAIPTLHLPVTEQSLLTISSPAPSTSGNSYLPFASGAQMDCENTKINITKQVNCETAKIRKSKGPFVSLSEYKKYKFILKKLKKCESDKRNLHQKYIHAKAMTKTKAFQIISKKMSLSAKLFCQMQFSQSGKQKQGRRFSLDEKILALSLYKPSPKAYDILSKLFILPSRQTLDNLQQKIDLNSGIDNIIFENLNKEAE